jgi:hypothetical protein
MNHYESVADALRDLRQRGYEADFDTAPSCLYCGDLDVRQDPEDFHIDEVYRFEGDCNPEDGAVVYAITSNTGVKGTLVDARNSLGVCKLSDEKKIDEQYAFIAE